MPAMTRWLRLAVLGLLLVGVLDGCVYLRLFAVKQQCADFDANFTFAEGEGLTLVFRHPVLLADDTVTLIGGPPSQVIAASPGADAHWIFRYHRAPLLAVPPPAPAPAPADTVAIDFGIHDGLVERVTFPPQVFQVVPVDLAKAMMRAMGHAKVDRVKRTATTEVVAATGAAPAPDRAGIAALFGREDEVVLTPDSERHLYRYRLEAPAASIPTATATATATGAAPAPAPGAVIGIVFRPGLDHAQQFQAGVSGLWLYLELPGAKSPASAPAPPREEAPYIPALDRD
jgi:hypothetical protein